MNERQTCTECGTTYPAEMEMFRKGDARGRCDHCTPLTKSEWFAIHQGWRELDRRRDVPERDCARFGHCEHELTDGVLTCCECGHVDAGEDETARAEEATA